MLTKNQIEGIIQPALSPNSDPLFKLNKLENVALQKCPLLVRWSFKTGQAAVSADLAPFPVSRSNKKLIILQSEEYDA